MKRLNRDRSELVETMRRYLRATHFDLPWKRVTDELRRLGRQNVTAYMVASSVDSLGGVMYPSDSMNVARDLLNDATFRDDFTVWANEISAQIELKASPDFQDASLVTRPIGMAQALARSAWPLFVGSPLPAGLESESMTAVRNRQEQISLDRAWYKLDFDEAAPCSKRHRDLNALLPHVLREDDERERDSRKP